MNWILTGLLFWGQAQAEAVKPIELTGAFYFQNQYQVEYQLELIELRGDDFTDENIDLLSGEGFTCSAHRPKHLICDRRLKGEVTEDLQKKVVEGLQGLVVKIHEPIGEPLQFLDTEFQKLWQVEQKVRVGEEVFFPTWLSWSRGKWAYQGGARQFRVVDQDRLSEVRLFDLPDQLALPQRDFKVIKRFSVKVLLDRGEHGR